MKFLIAGTGSIGQRHIRNIQFIDPNAEFIFLRRGARQDEFSHVIGAEVVSSLDEITNRGVDCAVIATPSALHTLLIEDLIVHGIPMYIEKPVVTTSQDIAAVHRVLDSCEYKVPTLVGCNLRFLPSLQKVREMLESGLIGNVVRATLQVGQWLPDWRPDQDYTKSYSASNELGGGVIMDLIHELDAARWLLGEFNEVHSYTASCPSLDIQSEAVACIIMKGKDTPLVSINMDYVSRKPVRRYEFIGDQGTIYWDLMERTLTLQSSKEAISIDCGDGGYDVGETYQAAMQSFISAVKSKKPLEQNINEGLKSVELALKIKEEANK